MTNRIIVCRLAFAACALLVSARGALASQITEIMKRIPAGTPEERTSLGDDLLKAGPEAWRELFGMITVPGKGDDAQARLAMSALAFHVSRPGAEGEREEFASALAGQLAKGQPTLVKSFLIQMLRVCGGPEAARAVGGLLLDEKLCEDATHALLSMRDGGADQLRAALPRARGTCRLTIIQALGVARDAESSGALLYAIADEDREIRLAAMHGLANIGEASAADALMKAAGEATGYERWRATEACLLLARRLNASGADRVAARLRAFREETGRHRERLLSPGTPYVRVIDGLCAPCRVGIESWIMIEGYASSREGPKRAEKIYRALWDGRTGDGERHVRCSALRGLAEVLGAEAFDQLRAAMKSDDMQIRAVATDVAISMPGEGITRRWIDELKQATGAAKIGTLEILARRGDAVALPAVLETLKADDENVRAAAIDAIASLGSRAAVPPLVALLGGEDAKERQAIQLALQRVRGEGVEEEIGRAITRAKPVAKVALLEVIASRGATSLTNDVLACATDGDANVRRAAIETLGALGDTRTLPKIVELLLAADASRVRETAEKALTSVCLRIDDVTVCSEVVAGAIPRANVKAHGSILRVLARLGGQRSLDAVRAAWGSPDEELKDAAVRALAEWRDAQAADDLKRIAKESDKLTHKVLALRGFVRVLGLPSDRPSAETLALLREAMEIASRVDDKKMVLGGLSSVPHIDALRWGLSYLEKDTFREEAAAAVVGVARAINGQYPDEAKDALKRVMAASKNQHLCKQAQQVVDHIDRFSDYVTSWLVSGPYRKSGTGGDRLLGVPFAPEEKGGDVKWKLWTGSGDRPWFVNFMQMKGVRGENAAVYVKAQVKPPQACKARLEVGSDDALKIWVNGAVVHDNNTMRGYREGEDKVEVALKDGWNTVLMKITQGGGDWSVGCRVRAADGSKIRGLRIKTE